MTAEWKSRITGSGEEDPLQLVANPRNWRIHPKGQQDALASVLDEVGWVQQILINKTTGNVVDGHLRVELAISREEKSVPVLYVELTEAEEGLILASLDPLSAMAAPDTEKLRALLAEVAIEQDDLVAYLDGIKGADPVVALTDPDDVPEVADEPYVKMGDLWLMGEHRLMCGDATSAEDVRRLMDGSKAAFVFTDPPYGVEYTGGTKSREALQGDTDTALYEVVDTLPMASRASAYVCFPMRHAPAVYAALGGWEMRNIIIWNKQQAQFGALGAHYHDKYEPIIYATKGIPRIWHGPTNEVTVWDIDRARANDYHPTQKPVALVARAMANSSERGAKVLDPFVGSGSTIIAAEQLGRRCYAMEIEPKYVQVAKERWEAFVGREATLAP